SETPTTSTTLAPTCTPGEVVCVSDAEQAVCSAEGQLGAAEPCPGGACVDGEGCVDCQPGAVRCDGEVLQQCSDALAWEPLQTCSAAQGLECDAGAMACTGECAPEGLEKTAAGCEFYAVTAVQLPQTGGIFAVVLENPGATDANVTISQKEGFEPVLRVVPAGATAMIELPLVDDLAGASKGELVAKGAYHIESDRPIRAYQYNTANITASSDSSLLWPRHTWGTSYFVASYDATAVMGGSYRGSWTVVGGADDIEVAA